MTKRQSARAGAWLAGVVLAAGSAAAQTAAPRAFDGNPDLNGVWQAIGTAHWDVQDHGAGAGPPDMGAIGAIPPGQGVVVGNEIPYRADALAQKQRNFENRWTDDPELKCFMPGVPRATYLPYPFRIIQGDRKIMFVYGFADANRTVHMDKENPEPPPLDTWMGRSHGRWEGDTLVVEAEGFKGVVRPRRQLRRQRPARRRALYAAGSERDLVRSDHRRPRRVHPPLDHGDAALPASRSQRAGPGVQVRGVLGGPDLRAPAQGAHPLTAARPSANPRSESDSRGIAR